MIHIGKVVFMFTTGFLVSGYLIAQHFDKRNERKEKEKELEENAKR